MKKMISLRRSAVMLLAVVTVLALAACDNDQTEVVNPLTEYGSLAELEDAVGFEVADFGTNELNGYVESGYTLIDGAELGNIAEVVYTDPADDPDTDEMIVRSAANCAADISGVTQTDPQEVDSNGVTVTVSVVEPDTYVAWWTQNDNSYSFYCREEVEYTYFMVLVGYLTAQ